MLPTLLRLPPKEAKRGKKIETRFFSMYLKPNNLEHNRFLFVVSKNSAKTAVLRHRIKRLLGEAARKISPKSKDFTLIAGPQAEKMTLRDIIQELQQASNK